MLSMLQQVKQARVVHLCFAITFFTSGLIVNLIQCILYFTIRPFSKWMYRKINWYLCATLYSRKLLLYSYWCILITYLLHVISELVFMGDWWSSSEIVLYIDKEDFKKYWGKEHAYCVMNHTYEIDWLIGWMFCDRIRLLGVSLFLNFH